MTAATSSIHPVQWAFFVETNQGEPPGYTTSLTGGTASAWASAEGSTAHRHNVIEASPAYLKRSVIQNPALTRTLLARNEAIPGLNTADGGNVVVTLHGSGAETSDASQVSQSSLMDLLYYCWGGLARGNTTAVAAAPTSDISYDVDAATNLAVGQIVFVEDADDTDRLFPQRILTLSSVSITTDQDLPFAIAENDVVHAAATLYPNADAMSDASDTDYKTVSLLYEIGGSVWEATGCKLQVDSIDFPRNDVPRISFSVFAANSFPPGHDNNPGTVTWTGTVQGDPGHAVGYDTKITIQASGATATACFDVSGATFTPGITVVPIETVTQCDGAMQGRSAYTIGKGETVFEANVFIDGAWDDAFDLQTYYNLKFYQVAGPGDSWVVQLPKCRLMEAPEYTEEAETQWYRLKFVAFEDDTIATVNDLTKSTFLVGLG